MTIVKKTVAVGKVIPRREIEVKAQVSGVVEKLFVEAGQTVRKGQVIARIALRPNALNVNQAEAQLQSAKINLQNQAKDLERYRKLVADGVISELQYNQYVTTYEVQKEAVTSAENGLQLLRTGATRSSGLVSNMIPATIDGTILDLPNKEGAFIIESSTFQSGTSLATLADMSDMIFEGLVDESVVLDKDLYLRSNYSANADIVLDKRENALAINEGNLIIEGDKKFVEVETGPQAFEKREIQTGLSDGINIEVVSGLTGKDKIKHR
jgi:HlyD family secretion protein